MFGFLLLSCAAPLPAPPKELKRECLIGLWDYKYASQEKGVMWFQENGIYISKHSPEARSYYCGLWWIEGDTICLRETVYYPDSEVKWSRNWISYRFRIDLRLLPVYKGKTNYGSDIGFSNRREPDWGCFPDVEP